MNGWLRRTEILVGTDGIDRLKNAHVLVVGLGGVGAYAAELICRAGIGKMTIVDGDVVEESNRNRQLPALISNQGRPKAEIMAERFRDINPDIELHVFNHFLEEKELNEVIQACRYDYVVDAIDTLSPKTFLILKTMTLGYPIVTALGSGGRFDPSKVEIADISKTYNCTLARKLRKRLQRHGIHKGLDVVFSSELIEKDKVIRVIGKNKASTVGTISYLPPVFGCYCASVVIRNLLTNRS